MSVADHADTIRPEIRHTRLRVLGTGEHPSNCKGCAADTALEALVVENQQLRREVALSFQPEYVAELQAEIQRLGGRATGAKPPTGEPYRDRCGPPDSTDALLEQLHDGRPPAVTGDDAQATRSAE
jgi:hypothetical protein